MQHALNKHQQGFTLLELLVVITLLAVLSVGALVAYDGSTESAQSAATATNVRAADQAIRAYRVATNRFPSQLDNLVTDTGVAPAFLAEVTRAAFANLPLADANPIKATLLTNLQNVGIGAVQMRTTATTTAGVAPNLQHNEGAAGADAVELVLSDPADATAFDNVAILPSWGGDGGGTSCSAGAVAFPVNKLATTVTALSAADGRRQNVINDSMEDDVCQLVLAFGFGHDAAHSTTGSPAAIASAPTFINNNINPSTNYARYVALFQVGRDGANGGAVDENIAVGELFTPRLVAVVDPQGRPLDEAISSANTAN